MGRFVAGVASALLLVGAGFFLWTGLAHKDVPALPGAPAAVQGLLASDTAVAAAPVADDPPQATEKTREEKRFARYDRDKNGKIDRDEYLLSRRKAFAKLDTNGDGKLSFEEYSVKAIAKFATADADHSGTLTPVEFATTRVQRKPKPRCAPVQARAVPEAQGDDEG